MKAFAPVAFLVVVTAIVVGLRHQLVGRAATHTALTAAVAPARRHTHRHRSVRTVRVSVGDTLGAIAIRAHTTVARLESLNPGLDPTALRVGQAIKVK